jgi:serine/threonine-protein kinase
MSQPPDRGSPPPPDAGGVTGPRELKGRIGKYDIVRPLGRGAMGMVYLAHDTVLERDVALKVMNAQIAEDPHLRDRFEREAKVVAKMAHPNVVTVFDRGYHEGCPYIVMELLKGRDLHKALALPPPLTLEAKVGAVLQVLAGLAHAHQLGIIHRDIKPANVFLCEDGTVKIMDFGVARLTTAASTATGSVFGTADYMSPEQVSGAHVDARSDLFSVGCVLFELATGRKPFHADSLMTIFYRIIHEEPDYLLLPDDPAHQALVPILRKALAKDLAARYPSAHDFATELREHLRVHAEAPAGRDPLADLVDRPPATFVPPRTAEHPARVATVVPARSPAPRPAAAPPPRARPAAPRTAPPPRTTARRRSSGTLASVWAVAAVVVIGGAGAMYWFVLRPSPPAPTPAPVTTLAAAPSTLAATPAPEPTPTAEPSPTPAPSPPPTVAPPPTFAEARGRAAAAVRGAQAAFRRGDYARAVKEAQAALIEDPGNADAERLLDSALAGQQAQARFSAAEAALGRGDLAGAQVEAEAGRSLAPWDGRGPDLLGRVQAAQRRAEQQRQQEASARIDDLLRRADAALAERQYDTAIGLYDDVLELDARNQRATLGRTSALGARALAQEAAGRAPKPAGRAFVAGTTSAQAATGGTGGPRGFEDSPEVVVRKATQAASLPGKVQFEVEPEEVAPGVRFTVKAYLMNEGQAPIGVQAMTVTTTVNGRRSSGVVPPLAKEVAPQQRALLLSVTDFWKQDTTAWAMDVLVRTAQGDSYRNALTWK